GSPKVLVRRVFTSHTTTVSPSRRTRSISPSRQRQLRSSRTMPRSVRYCCAMSSPAAPRAARADACSVISTTSATSQRRSVGDRGLTRERCGPAAADLRVVDALPGAGSKAALGHLELVLGQLLDVDVLEGDHAHLAGEARG